MKKKKTEDKEKQYFELCLPFFSSFRIEILALLSKLKKIKLLLALLT